MLTLHWKQKQGVSTFSDIGSSSDNNDSTYLHVVSPSLSEWFLQTKYHFHFHLREQKVGILNLVIIECTQNRNELMKRRRPCVSRISSDCIGGLVGCEGR